MSKIKIRVTINNDSKELMAIVENNKLKYKEDKTTTIIWNEKENTLYRETDELIIRCPFNKKKKTDGIIEVKENKIEIKVPIKTKKLERKNHNIELEYEVDGNNIKYCVEEII